ncbi:hypothetical protein [Methanobrevibacter millerae]|nr:hypothetical protein [Methanobrevibacter millerae]
MFHFIKLINGLFFDSSDAIIGNYITLEVFYAYPDTCHNNC